MHNTSVATSMKLQNLLDHIEKDPHVCRKRLVLEVRSTRHYIEAGTTFQCEHGAVTVLCIVDPEIWYFQGGLVYAADKLHFSDLVRRSAKAMEKRVPDCCSGRLLNRMEVEFILGIISVVGPLECWTIVGSDLIRFLTKNRKKIDAWILRIAALLLTRMVLKRYARGIYEKVSMSMSNGIWSNLSEIMATDDVFIARFTGRLLGAYKSEALMDRAITERWAVFSSVLDGLESLGRMGSIAGEKHSLGLQSRTEGFVRSLNKFGINISINEVHLLLHLIHRHLQEIHNTTSLLNVAFEGCRKPAKGLVDGKAPSAFRGVLKGLSGE